MFLHSSMVTNIAIQGWLWQPALGLALVLKSCQFCLIFKVKPEINLPDVKNYQGNRGNLEVGLALENLPEPPLQHLVFYG